MNKLIPAAWLIACLLVLPATATAEPYNVVPSDNSAADQYAETFPGADGDHRPPTSGDSKQRAGHGNPALPAGVTDALSKLGPSGEATAQVLERTAVRIGGDVSSGQSPRSSDPAPIRSDSAKRAAADLGPETSGFIGSFAGLTGGGLGILVPLSLLAIAVAAVAALVRRNPRS